jgi:hypothetical protein
MFKRLARPALALLVVLALSALPARSAFADPRDFTLINNTAAITFVQVYVSPSGAAEWGDDILGGQAMGPGQYANITFSRFDGSTCLYDILIVGENGEHGQLNQVDLCSTSTVTFSDSA